MEMAKESVISFARKIGSLERNIKQEHKAVLDSMSMNAHQDKALTVQLAKQFKEKRKHMLL
jgi:hypothetical protein